MKEDKRSSRKAGSKAGKKKKKSSGIQALRRKTQKSLKKKKKTLSRTGANMLSAITGGSSPRTFTVTDEMIQKTEKVLPPAVPDSLDGTNTRDVSLYSTTWNMEGLSQGPTPQQIAFWLPLGYDIYVIALQSCKRVANIAPNIIEFLEKKFERYEDYTHFLPIENGASAKDATSLVLMVFVHTSLLEERVFRKRSPQMLHLRKGDADDILGSDFVKTKGSSLLGGAAITVEINVFDTTVLLVNTQLTKGQNFVGERVKDLQILMDQLHHAKVDHIILMGDMAIANQGNGRDDNLVDYLNVTSDWNPADFAELSKGRDEFSVILKAAVPKLAPFKEMDIAFPPTNSRVIRPRFRQTREGLAQMFHPEFDLENLYSYSNSLPSYSDRILFNTLDEGLLPCLGPGKSGSCEGVVGALCVPVFTTFRVGSRSFGNVTQQKRTRFVNATRAPSTTSTTITFTTKEDDLPPPVVDDSDTPSRSQQEEPRMRLSTLGTIASDFEGDDYLRQALGKLMENLGGKKKNQSSEAPGREVTELEGEAIGDCSNCYAPIQSGKPHFEASGKLFHKNCFKCVFCDNPIHKKYFMINDELYCEDCYQDMYNPICQGEACGERIDGAFVKTEAGAYHTDCFKCDLCDTPLAEYVGDQIKSEPFTYHRKQLLCMEHAAEVTGRNCFVCDDTIVEEHAYQTVNRSGEVLDLHKECFKCVECDKDIASQDELSYLIKGNDIFCAEHGGMICKHCSQPISNSMGHVAIFNSKYHDYCTPKCSDCGEKVGSDTVKTGDDWVCGNCVKKSEAGKIVVKRISAKRGAQPVHGARKLTDLTVFSGVNNSMVESGAAIKEKTDYHLGTERVPRESLMSFSGFEMPPPPSADEAEDDPFANFMAPPPPPIPDFDDEAPPPPKSSYDSEKDMMENLTINGMMQELNRLTEGKDGGLGSTSVLSLLPKKYHRESDGETTLAPPAIEDDY